MSAEARYFRVGMFVFLGILLVGAFVVVLGGQGLFRQSVLGETYFTESVQGVSVGSPITMRGVQLGTVTRISFVGDDFEFDTFEEGVTYGDMVRVIFEIGQSVELRLFVGQAQSGPAIPESAVVDDGGRPVVFVQLGGESFERRPVQLGSREHGYVHVLEGVAPGERIVHRGAYLVRLAAMSTTIPAHGHVH